MSEKLQKIIDRLKNSPLEDGGVVYFVGIGGIGMSALARYFNEQGAKVYGYDKTPTTLTGELEKGGMQIHYEDNVSLIPKNVQLVVYTPAIPKEHSELIFFKENNYPLYKRSEVLDAVTNSSFNICVAGTHGKTTITTMIAHILRHTGYGCNAFLGGIAVNYNSNFWSSKRNVCVAEADEYDRSFLRLTPNIAVVTAMDADHLDIYGTAEAMEDAFIEFTGKIKKDGLLISKFGLGRGSELKGAKHITYSQQNRSAD
ncbi:MAG: Mur ligase domain-containing protein, partial [Sphingobacteriales bacterium]